MPPRLATPGHAEQTIGRYAIYGEIASGGMATVHFGRLVGAVGFSRPVAIKRLHPQFAKDPDFRAGFIDEARLVSRIRHQNVVPTLDVVASEDELFLVMEYVQGESLWRLMKAAHNRRVRVPPHISIAIVSHVLHGLHAAHEAHTETGQALEIVHRDVSPQNVLVGTDGAARVLDFGIARAAQRAEVTQGHRGVKGKISYMAPEQLAGSVATRQVDVYAASVILWELLAGRRLFQRSNPQALLVDKLFRGAIPAPSGVNEHVPRAIDVIVLKGLARDPKDRHRTAREMAVALEGCGKMATASEVGEWVEQMAHDALEKRAGEVAACESLSLPAAQEIRTPGTPSTSPLVASIGPLSMPSQLPSLPPLPSLLPVDLAPSPAGPPRRDARMRRSLASILEPDLEAKVLERLRHLAFERKRIVAASLFAAFAFSAFLAAVRALSSSAGSEPRRAVAAVAHRGAPNLLVEPLSVCPDGMAVIPGGRFFMGSDDDLPAERPAHHVTLTPYCIDVFEVTTDDYKACSERGDCRRAGVANEWSGILPADKKTFDALCNIRDPAGRGRHPINCIDWEMATQYCAARGARLPTEAEWEFAARSSDGRKFPWGDAAPSARLLNACGKECLEWGKRNHVEEAAMYVDADGWATTAPVGSFPEGRSKYGVQDLVGNVWEWVADFWGPYDGEARDDPHGPTGGRERVIRGGAWNGAYADWVRPTTRYHDPPETKSYGIGFRCSTDQGRFARDVRQR